MLPGLRRITIAAFAVAATLVSAAPAGAVTITEFPVGTPGASQPTYIVSSPTGRLWFTDIGTDHGVRQMTTAGELVGGPLKGPAGTSAPTGDLAFDADGTLGWSVNEIGPADPHLYVVFRRSNGSVDGGDHFEGIRDAYAFAGAGDDLFVTFRLLGPDEQTEGFTICRFAKELGQGCIEPAPADTRLTDLTLDAGGHLWAMQPEGDVARRTNAARTGFDLVVPLPGGSRPGRAALGPDGNIWVAGFGNSFDASNTRNQILRITPAGAVTPFPLPPGRGPNEIVAGPDGALWFTEFISGSIGRITTCGEYKSYPLPAATSGPYGIAAGADGALWFTESGTAKVGRLVPNPPSGDCAAPPRPAADTTGPALSSLRFSRTAFRAARSGASASARKKAPLGAKVSFNLSETAKVAFTVARKAPGRSVGGRCVKPKPANAKRKRCSRLINVKGSFSVDGKAGGNSFTFRGLIGGKPLRPGAYRLGAQATDAAGNRSLPASKNFTILP